VIRAVAAWALLLAACASTDNRELLDELQQAALAAPDAELDACVASPGPYRLVGEAPQPVTLSMVAGKVPVVEGAINGVTMPFLLDTGTTHIVLSATAARDSNLYLPPGLTVDLIAPGYRSRYRVGAPKSLALAGSSLAGGVVAVPERRSDLARRLGVRGANHATVGSAVLSNFRVTFDFGKREVKLDPHGQQPFAGVLWVAVEVNGERCLMLVDSGANGVFLEPAFARKLGLIDEDEQERHAVKADHAGGARMTPVRIDRLRCGSHTFENLKANVVLVGDEGEPPGALPRGGLLGLAGLGPHRWTVDYGERRLILNEVR